MTRRRLAVLSAGLSQPSATRMLADQLAAATREALELLDVQSEVTVIDVRDHAHDAVNSLLTGFPSASLKSALDTVAAADGLIAVSPIFNASYSGLFKSFVDSLVSVWVSTAVSVSRLVLRLNRRLTLVVMRSTCPGPSGIVRTISPGWVPSGRHSCR